MNESEGVIKYRLDYRATAPEHYPEITELNAWRSIFIQLQLVGQDRRRYQGLAFGNLSFRPDQSRQFVITGSQTGGLVHLSDEHVSKIVAADPLRNLIVAEGGIQPSSEALTHAAVYQADERIKAVVHVHSPVIWRSHGRLDLPVIAEAIPYGTPDMAKAVMSVCRQFDGANSPVIVMLGHEDGVISFGKSIAEAGLILIKTLAAAIETAD